jgi:hypothetical protein
VRDLLLRENSGQDAYGAEDREIYYENRSHSRFDTLVPLFRHVNEHQPYGGAAYKEYWALALEAFYKFFSQIGAEPPTIETNSRDSEQLRATNCMTSGGKRDYSIRIYFGLIVATFPDEVGFEPTKGVNLWRFSRPLP